MNRLASGLVVLVEGEAYGGIVDGVIGRQPVRPKRIAIAIVTGLIVFLAGGSPEAQQATKVPRVGFLNPVDRSAPYFEAFRQRLADLGYVEGRNIAIEPRFAEGQYERFPDLHSLSEHGCRGLLRALCRSNGVGRLQYGCR
jgi:hypothetical protein